MNDTDIRPASPAPIRTFPAPRTPAAAEMHRLHVPRPNAPGPLVPERPRAPFPGPSFPGPFPQAGPPPMGWAPPPVPPAPPARPTGRRPRRTGAAVLVALACLVGGATAGAVAGHAASASPGGSVSAQADPVAAAADTALPSTVQILGDDSSGSGVVLSTDGTILTNAHVVAGIPPDRMRAVLADGRVVALQLVGSAPKADLAVVRASDAAGLQPAQFGDSNALRRGQSVLAIGEPLGLSGSVTRGIVSAVGRPVPGGPSESILDMIQTDAALNPGNSGGPLVDTQGRVVGITSSGVVADSEGGRPESLGFAIPIDHARRIADELVRTGHATVAGLAVTVRDADSTGAAVTVVTPGSGPQTAGLLAGDVITRFGARPISTADDLAAAVQSSVPGSTVDLTVTGADGTSRVVTVPLESGPA